MKERLSSVQIGKTWYRLARFGTQTTTLWSEEPTETVTACKCAFDRFTTVSYGRHSVFCAVGISGSDGTSLRYFHAPKEPFNRTAFHVIPMQVCM